MFITMIVSTLVAVTPQEPSTYPTSVHFQRSGALSHKAEFVQVAIDRKTNNQIEYVARLQVQINGGNVETKRADSRTCPALREVLTRLSKLASPVIVLPGFDQHPSDIMVDGAGYTLTVPTADPVGQSSLTWRSNSNTALAAWIDLSLKDLEACWKSDSSNNNQTSQFYTGSAGQ